MIHSLFAALAVVPKKEKPTTVKKEPVDLKSLTPPPLLPKMLPKMLPAAIVSSLTSAASLSKPTSATKSVSAPSTPSQRSTKELVAFLLNDDRTDEKAKEILKKVVLSHSVKLMKEKQEANKAQLVSKPNVTATTTTTTSVTAKQLTKQLHTTKPVMVAQSAKPIIPVTVGVVQSVSTGSKPHVAILSSSTVSALPAVKSVDPKSSPPKMTGVSLSRSACSSTSSSPSGTQSSVLKTGNGPSGLTTSAATLSPTKGEKRKEKKKKIAKDSLSLLATLTNTGAVTNSTLKTASGSTPSHMLTSTAGLSPGILQYITSGGSAPLIKVITKAAGSSQHAQPTTAAPTTIITTSDGRLLLTGGGGVSQPQVSIAQTSFNSGKSIPSQSSKGAKSGGVDGGGVTGLLKKSGSVTGLLKKSGSVDTSPSKSVIGGALSSTPRQQLKITPVIQIPRVSPIQVRTSSASALASSGSTQPASNPNTAASVAKSTATPPPPPLATITTSAKGTALDKAASVTHPQSGKAVIASSQPLKRLKLETLSATGQQQQQQDEKHKKAPTVVNNNQPTVLKAVTTTTAAATVTPVRPAQTVVQLSSGTTYAQVISQLPPDGFSIPSLPKLVSSSKPVGRPVVRHLSLATTTASVTKDMPPLTGKTGDSYRVVPETPPLSTAPLNESSPLKSPVEQIMEEHSYLGSSSSHGCSSPPVQPAGQNPWQLQLARTSSPEQRIQLQSGENVVPKGPTAHPKDQ